MQDLGIVSGAGLTKAKQFKHSSKDFFPVKVLASKFCGKFHAKLNELYISNNLAFSSSCKELHNSYSWNEFRDSLYTKRWIPFIKETFNGFGNAIDYIAGLAKIRYYGFLNNRYKGSMGDKWKFEVIDSPYFPLVFTLPHELGFFEYTN